MQARSIDRRSLLLGAAGAMVLAACGGDDDDGGAGTGLVDPVEGAGDQADGPVALIPAFADGLRSPPSLAMGTRQRAPFVVFGPDGLPLVNNTPQGFPATLSDPAGVTTDVELVRHDADIPTPYYPLVFDPTGVGEYALTVDVNGQSQQLGFVVVDPAELDTVQVGDPLRPVATPTFSDARGVDPICTRFDPCPYHERTLTEVLEGGTPTVLLISTPGFCQTEVCGPVLELLIAERGDDATGVVHAEVYTKPAELGEVDPVTLLAPVMTTYGLTYEPSIMVAGADGLVTAKLGFTWDATELAEALATVS